MDSRISDDNWAVIFGEGDTLVDYASIPTVAGSDGKRREVTYRRADVEEVIAVADGENGGDPWLGVFRMRDGWFLFVSAGCDCTGWDCKSNGDSWTAETLEGIKSAVPIKASERLWPAVKS